MFLTWFYCGHYNKSHKEINERSNGGLTLEMYNSKALFWGFLNIHKPPNFYCNT